MGTRSIVTFIEKFDKTEIPLVSVYQQYDGYLSGVGRELCDFLSKKKIINGIGFDQHTPEYANGCGCLAAQFIHDFKTEVGGLYIYPYWSQAERKEAFIDYYYDVIVTDAYLGSPEEKNKTITIRVSSFGGEPFFEGTIKELLDYIKRSENDDE